MKRKTKICKRKMKKNKFTRRNMTGGNLPVSEFKKSVQEYEELLDKPEVQKGLKEAADNRPISLIDFILNNWQKYLQEYIKVYMEGLKAANSLTQLANNPQGLLAAANPQMAAMAANPQGLLAAANPQMAAMAANPQGILAAANPQMAANPEDLLSAVKPNMDAMLKNPELTKILNKPEFAKISEDPMNDLLNNPDLNAVIKKQIDPHLNALKSANEIKTGGKSKNRSNHKLPIPYPLFMQAMRSREASMVGGRTRRSIKEFLG
jgi:hypothetical protein